MSTTSSVTFTAATVTAADGTRLATWVTGSGPGIVLIDAALSTHQQSAKLAALLAPRFAVTTYDRRGRAGSGDAQPERTEVALEVADIEALVDAAGGRAVLFGSSSGAALAIEAAARLGDKVIGVFAYEPPFIVDGSRAPLPADLPERIAALVAAGKRPAAERAFFREAMGIPAPFVALMRFMPTWGQGAALTHTLRYDFAVLAGTQNGSPLPVDRWSALRVPGIVMVGSKSESFFHSGAKALAALCPTIEYVSLEGGHHGSAVMSPDELAIALADFAGSISG